MTEGGLSKGDARWGARLPIRKRLLLLLLALAIPFGIYVGLSTWRQAHQEQESVKLQMLSVARLTASRLDDHVGSIRQLLSVLSQSVGTTRADAAANGRLMRRLAPRLPAQIHNIAVWDAEGNNIGSLNPGLDSTSRADRKFFKDAMATNDLSIEAPVTATTNGELVGVFAIAIERDGRLVGVVSASTPLKPLQNLLAPQSVLPAGAVVTVTNADGIVMARSIDPEKWIGRNLSTGSGGFADSIRQGEGVRDGTSADGVHRIGGFSMAERVPWLVYVGTPKEIALAPVQSRLAENLVAGGLMLLIGIVVAVLVSETISSPLRQLSQDAEALQRGDLSHRTAVDQGGEIGQLAATVNRMADALQERATALQASRERLRQITDNIPAMISYLDIDQRFRFANRLYLDWLGTDPADLLGRSLREFYGEEAFTGFRQHTEEALAGQRVTYECVLDTLGGPRRVQVAMVPHEDIDRRVVGLYVLMQDVTEARELEAQRARSEERLQLALEGSDQALFDWDVARDVVYLSAQAAVLRGLPGEESITSPSALREFVHPDDLKMVIDRQRAAITGEAEAYDAEFRIRNRSSGQWVWLRGRGRVVERDANGRARRLAGTYVDITRRRAVEERLRHMAEFDSLTGLPNRAQFNDRLLEAMQRTEADGKPMALLFLDIDHFKAVNDNLGHEAGDDVLKVFARTLESAVRTTDTVARLAGDEFTVVLDGIGHTDDARAVAQNLVTRAKRTVRVGERSVDVATSIGIAIFHGGELDPASLLRRADLALYKAKRQGRNSYAIDDDRPESGTVAA
jgi:diguanylate cyclase (GGDEF)-like protein/PAS domain S-box-containing protein